MAKGKALPKICCPHCGDPDSLVTDTIPDQWGVGVRRTRLCGGCAQKYYTEERIWGPQHKNPLANSTSPHI